MIGHPFTSPQPPPGLSGSQLQSWLRRRIATLEAQQVQRIELNRAAKKGMNAAVARTQLEIDNLKTRLTIGVAQ